MVALRAHSRDIATLLLQPRSQARRGAPPQRLEGRTEQGQRGDSGAQGAAKEARRGRPLRRGGAGAVVTQIIYSQARLLELERKIKETEELEARLEALEIVLKARSSTKKGLGRLYDRL